MSEHSTGLSLRILRRKRIPAMPSIGLAMQLGLGFFPLRMISTPGNCKVDLICVNEKYSRSIPGMYTFHCGTYC